MAKTKKKRRLTRAEKIAAAKAEGRGKPPPSKYARKKADMVAENLGQKKPEGGGRES